MHNSTRIESGPFAHSFTDTTRCASPLLLLLCSRRSVANAEDLPVFLHHHHRCYNISRQSAASPIRTNPHAHTHIQQGLALHPSFRDDRTRSTAAAHCPIFSPASQLIFISTNPASSSLLATHTHQSSAYPHRSEAEGLGRAYTVRVCDFFRPLVERSWLCILHHRHCIVDL